MALTATLALDIQKFQTGLSTAEVSLRTFERAGATINRDLSRMLEGFSGQKVVAEAARMVEAVERIGGASKLTEEEQRRVNATVGEAIAKYQALGQTAPENLTKLHAATLTANTGSSALLTTIGNMAAAFSVSSLIDRGVSSLFSFGRAAVTSASNLVDLHNATGASIESLQRWGLVADQSGVELEQMTTAAFKLGAKIGGDDTSVAKAVDKLGISFATLKSMKPEAQMDEILSKADAFGPSQERNAILVDIFGTKGAIAMARVVEGYRDVAGAATVAGDAQVRALDRAGDRWAKFVRDLGTGFVSAMGNALLAVDSLGTGIQNLTADERNQLAFLKKSGGDLEGYIQQLERAHGRLKDIDLSPKISTTDSLGSFVKQLGDVQREQAKLISQSAELDAALKLGSLSLEELALKFGVSEAAIRMYREQHSAATVTATAHAESMSRVNGELDPLTRLLIQGRIEMGGFATETDNAARQMEELDAAILASQGQARDANGEIVLLSKSLGQAAADGAALTKWAQQHGAVFGGTVQQMGREVVQAVPLWTGAFNSFAAGLPGIIQGAFQGGGNVIKSVGSLAGSSIGTSLVTKFGPKITSLLGPALGGAFNLMIPGLGALMGPLLSKIGSLFKGAFGPSADEKAGRESVAAFEAQLWSTLTAEEAVEAGGVAWKKTVIAIRDAYLKAGKTEAEALAAAERLWKSSKVSAEESKKVIEEIQAVIGALPKQTTLEVDVNYNDQRERSSPPATPPPEPPTPPESGSDRAPFVNPLAGVVGAVGQVIMAHVYIDGREVAYATAPYLPGALKARGVF